MNIGVFSEFGSGISQNSVQKNTDKSNKQVNEQINESISVKSKNTVKQIAPIILPIAAIPVTAAITYKLANKNVKSLKNEIKTLTREIAKLQIINEERARLAATTLEKHVDTAQKGNAQIWSALLAVAGLGGVYNVGRMSAEDRRTVTSKIKERVDDIDKKSTEALDNAQHSLSANANSLGKKYMVNVDGIQLLHNPDSLNKNAQKYNVAIRQIQNAAPRYLFDAPKVKPITSPNPTLWSITSEFAPIKEGGLGSVPVEIQNNVVRLGINIPTFIPMYQQNGIASFREENGKYFYSYKGKEFELDKVASFKLDTYQAGKSKTEDVEIFVNNSVDKFGNKKQLVFIKNDNYFNGTIYQASEKTEEPEKFAFFSKAVYEFAKSKEDIKSVKGLVIPNKEVFDSIKPADGLILNDWQASPVAALARYKAPLENSYGQLSDIAAEKLSNMRIITIGHNAMYQGSTRNNNDDVQRREATSNILNTLFDNFAFDIVSNALTNASQKDSSDYGLRNLDNVLLLNQDDPQANHTNLLNMGICLSDYFHPVSQNYANELTSGKNHHLSGELEWALTRKRDAGSLFGIINGNDFNNLSIEAKVAQIKQQTGLDFAVYSKSSDISDIMSARLANKINFYNNYILPFSLKNNLSNKDEKVEAVRKLSSKLEFVDPANNTNLPKLSDEELTKVPVITSVGRLVSQKGVSLMCDAIKILLDNWDSDFPGKPKPIFYLAGQDGEGGIQRKFIEELKEKKLSQEDSNRVIFAHGFVPVSAMMAASDFFLLPSLFEPCGLTQGETFAVATPVIASAVGGIVDTVNRNGKINGVLTNKAVPLSSKEFYKAMKEALNIYFDKPDKYKDMVKDSLAEDFSWIQKGKQGPVFDYLDKIGINRSLLPDIS